MKSQTSSQSAEKQPHIPPKNQHAPAALSRNSTRRLQSSIEDLHECITIQAYQLYAQRGWREGGALEDWLDAEREILGRNIFSQALTDPPQDIEP